ncbi:MAG: hypothetical protein PHS74_09355 [Lachnospiraceae bacterium]|nr:hypothetical protein [Lachnospiraceae bacterium]
MSKLILCIGEYAKTPYWIDRSEMNIYSIEELCYFIRENIVLLDKEFMRIELGSWLEKECGLKELGQELLSCIRQHASLNVFVSRIMRYAHYCSESEIQEMDQQITENAEMNNWEKRKTRVDFYFKNGRFAIALREYESLRKELNLEDRKLSARISNNIGTIYAHLYAFDMAAVNFLRAYEEDEKEEYFFVYLAAKRMLLSEKEYVDFVAQEVEHYDISLQLEKTLENLNSLWEESDEKHMLEELNEWRNGKRVNEYYETVEQLTNQWKDVYRDSVLNNRK